VISRTIAARALPLAIVLGACATVTATAITTSAASLRPRPQRLLAAASMPTASLTAAFEPERLGGRTTLSFGFRIAGANGLLPPALTAVDLSYPANIGIAFSGLGLDTCTAGELEASGLAGCQSDSIMGFGSVTAELALGSAVVGEPATFTILRAPDEEGQISLLFDAVGASPLSTSAVFTAALLPAPAPFGGQLSINVPLIASLPGAPDVSIVELRATLGPHGVTYYEQAKGRLFAYQPPGILLPDSCPRGGFPFAVQFSFVDGSHASARATEPCPGRGRPVPRR
jgi:hypothetical protein